MAAVLDWIWDPAQPGFIPGQFSAEYLQAHPGAITTFCLEAPVFQSARHYHRLGEACRVLQLPSPWPDLTAWEDFLQALWACVALPGWVVRLCVGQGASNAPLVWVSLRSFSKPKSAFVLTVRTFERPLPLVKTTHDLAWATVLAEIQVQGFDEALRVNAAGHVAEGIYANVFGWTPEGKLVTPCPDKTRCLTGVMRHVVLDCAANLGINVQVVAKPVPYFESLPGLFLTNAVRGVVPVVQLNQTRYDLDWAQKQLSALQVPGYDSSSFS